LPFMGGAPQTTKSLSFVYNPEFHTWGQALRLNEDLKLQTSMPDKFFIRSMRELELEENDRLLYVAMTRAKKSLFLSTSGVSQKNSWFSKISLDLSPGEHQRDHYSYQVLTEEPKEEITFESVQNHILVRDEYVHYNNWEFHKKTDSVSKILDDQIKKTPNRILDSNQAAEEGTIVHRLFEILHTEDEKSVLQLANKWFGNSMKFERALENLKNQQKIPIMELIKAGHVEWGFAFKNKNSQVEGKIDLWGEVNGEYWIVDYKTGNPNNLEKAFVQLQFYSWAFKKLYPDRNFKLAAVFPFHNKFETRESLNIAELDKKFGDII
jgi:ATP-dependent exoDNAse (exonuclease V) beta subunit